MLAVVGTSIVAHPKSSKICFLLETIDLAERNLKTLATYNVFLSGFRRDRLSSSAEAKTSFLNLMSNLKEGDSLYQNKDRHLITRALLKMSSQSSQRFDFDNDFLCDAGELLQACHSFR